MKRPYKILYVANAPQRDSPLGYCPNWFWIARSLDQIGCSVHVMDESNSDIPDVLLELGDTTYDFILCEEGRLRNDHINNEKKGQTVIKGLFKYVMDVAGIPVIPWITNIFFGIMRREIELDYNPIFKSQIVLSTDGGHAEQFKSKGINHACLRQGIYQEEAYIGKPNYPTKAEIVFVGSIYEEIWPYRRQLIDFLEETYKNRFLHVGKRGEVRHETLNNLLATVKIVIGDSVKSDNYWSNRVYEMIGRGGFLIHPMVPGLEKEFEPYKHFIPYNYGDFKGLEKKIDYYLKHDEEREKIKMAGFEYCKANHTYLHRAKELIRILEEKKII